VSDRGLAYKSIDQITTTTATAVSGDYQVFFDSSADKWVKQDSALYAPQALDATDTITAAEHANRILYCTTAATLTWTLPTPSGTGNWYLFLQGILATGDKVIKCASTTATALIGSVTFSDGDAAQGTGEGFKPAATSDVITMNATTTGGILGDWIKVTDVATEVWFVEGQLSTAAGSNPATPFSST